jgi:hypothetical protein
LYALACLRIFPGTVRVLPAQYLSTIVYTILLIYSNSDPVIYGTLGLIVFEYVYLL